MNHEGLLCRRDAMSAAQHGRWSALVTSCLAVAIVAAGSAQQDVRLVSAVKAQNTALIQQLLSKGVDVNAARADGVTALLWAAHWDDHETAELLLEAGANPNVAEDQGVTPLARGAENTSAVMVSKLLAAGAVPNQAQTNGLTPLMWATANAHHDVMEMLLVAGQPIVDRIENSYYHVKFVF